MRRPTISSDGLHLDCASYAIDDSDNILKSNSILRRILSSLSVTALVIATYIGIVRPSELRWGATDAELARGMPGDALSSQPTFLSTRAITIENLGSARGIRSAERIVPELQHIVVGDPLPLSAAGGLVVHAIAPNRFIVWSGESGTYPGAFTWALYPVDSNHTRLVSRIQWSHHWTQPLMLAIDLFTEFADHVAVKNVPQGVKDRAEGRVEPFARQAVECALLVWAFVAFLAAIGCVLRRPVTRLGWFAAMVAGMVWLVVWYAPINIGVGVALNVLVIWLLRSAGRRRQQIGSTYGPSSPVLSSSAPSSVRGSS